MTTIDEALMQALRAWLKAYCVPGSTLTDAQVIVSEALGQGMKPPLSFLTVKVLSSDVPDGQDEILHGTAGSAPTVQVRGGRRFTASIQGFGSAASDWLTEARLSLARESVADFLEDLGLSVYAMGGANNATALLDTGFEPRFIQEVEGLYQLTSAAETLVALATVQVTQTQSSSSAGDLDGSFTVTL